MKMLFISSVFISFLLAGCLSAKKRVSPKNEGKSYNHLFIIANTADLAVRVRLEKEFEIAADAKGIKVVKSIDVIPQSIKDPNPPTKEEFLIQVKSSGCDAFFIVYFIKNGENTKYVPGEQFKGTESWFGGLALQLLSGKKGNGNDERSEQTRKDIYKSGYYKKEKGFYLISVLFDVASEQIIYSDKSEQFDDSDLISFSHGYMTELMKYLETKKIIKK